MKRFYQMPLYVLLGGVGLQGCSSYTMFPESQRPAQFRMAAEAANADNFLGYSAPQPTITPAVSYAAPLPQLREVRRAYSTNPAAVIQQANKHARHSPDQAGYSNAMMQYDFDAGALYEVHAAPLRLTTIQLQPGEEIQGKPAAGDTARWLLGVNTSQVNGQSQQHVLIKPKEHNLNTSLVINTNRRTYLLELSSHPKTWMAAVSWRYPHYEYQQAQQQQREQQAQQREQRPLIPTAVDHLNFAYAVRAPRWGKRPSWTPLQVFDDGQKVYIRFPAARNNYEAPALFVRSGNDLQWVSYRVKGDYYIVDRLFDHAELRVGTQRPVVVNIQRQG